MRMKHLMPQPVTPVEKLAVQIKEYLSVPDPGPLYTLMGSVAANMMEGAPVWLMFVGPPSCGKTELLNSLLSIPHIIEAAEISSEGSFLSATPARDRAKHATGGLLKEIGNYGGLVLNDFTSILSKSTDKIGTIMSVFRETYSGRWTRHVGSEGGQMIQWTGKLAIFGGVTNKIDRHHQLSSELGERWVYFRFDERETFQDCMLAGGSDRDPEWRQGLRLVVAEFFKGLGLGFGTPLPRREYTMTEKLWLYRLATVTARCRSGVARDPVNREVIAPRETEVETRLYTVFAQLLLGMDCIGVPESLRWKLITKVAMDSMPVVRRMAIQTVGRKPISVQDLARAMGCDLPVIKRLVRDLEIQRVFEQIGDIVSFSPWMNDNYRKLNHEGLTVVPRVQELF